MAFFSENLALPDNAFEILRNLIMDKTGIFFEDSKKDLLADKLSDRVIALGMNSFIDYYYLLKYDAAGLKEWNEVFNLLSVNETFFWREFDQVDVMMKHVLPQFVKNYPDKTFYIWCAGCSTGEEPLTILMALDHAGWTKSLNIKIIANDGSPKAIAKAREGLYGERSLRLVPPEIRDKYFTPENNKWRVKPDILGQVQWEILNLTETSQFYWMPVQNVIFCRNVFIYFREETIKKITDFFFSKLQSPGHLFIGVSESLYRIKSPFELTELGRTFVYKKN